MSQYATRQTKLATAMVGMLLAWACHGARARQQIPRDKVMTPIFEQIVCKWTPENPRHDHQLIFPLKRGRLMFLWNNVESHSNRPRTPLTAAISTDEGQTWGEFRDIDARPDHDAAYPHVFFQDDEAIVTYYTRLTKEWARDAEVTTKVFRIDQFYE